MGATSPAKIGATQVYVERTGILRRGGDAIALCASVLGGRLRIRVAVQHAADEVASFTVETA